MGIVSGKEVDSRQHIFESAIDAHQAPVARKLYRAHDVRRVYSSCKPTKFSVERHRPDPLRQLPFLNKELRIGKVIGPAEVVEMRMRDKNMSHVFGRYTAATQHFVGRVP